MANASNRTLQDRLVNELRLAGITTVAAANAYLQERFIPDYNATFISDAAEPTNTDMRRFRIALAQINATVGDLEGNVAKIRAGLEQARALGCRLVAFPELAVTGYPPEDLLFKPAFIEANLRALADLVKASAGLTAVVGFVDKRDDIFNAAAILHDGTLAGVYHKQFLPNYGVFDEDRYFQAGTEAPVFELRRHLRFAVNICEDIWYPTGPTTRRPAPAPS